MARGQRDSEAAEPGDDLAADVIDTEKSEEVGPGQDGPDWKPSADEQVADDEPRDHEAR